LSATNHRKAFTQKTLHLFNLQKADYTNRVGIKYKVPLYYQKITFYQSTSKPFKNSLLFLHSKLSVKERSQGNFTQKALRLFNLQKILFKKIAMLWLLGEVSLRSLCNEFLKGSRPIQYVF
jgi:hypothetical protein